MVRFETTNPCAECGQCKGGERCEIIRRPLRRYDGIRLTADGFDCALPVSIDSHNHCAYGCLYCFADNLESHRETAMKAVGQTPLANVEALFSGGGGKRAALLRKALKYDRRNANGYPTAVQLGALCEPCDTIELNQGWLLGLIALAVKYRQPVRMSTKGKLLQLKDYQAALAQAPELFWVAFSLITPDDELLEQIDVKAPNATERLQTMASLSKLGVKTSLRLRPMLPGVSDATPRHPKAYKELLERVAQAGAQAVSIEVAFTPGNATADIKRRWADLGKLTGIDYLGLYAGFGKKQVCNRPSYLWTEGIMHAVVEEAHKLGMTVGVSDPVWKQLTDTGCCCGILPDDPVFGNWQEESATNQLLLAKTKGIEIGPNDIVPPWAHDVPLSDMVNAGVGPLIAYARRHTTWADRLRQMWNTPKMERAPLNYFQGAMLPTRRDDNGDLYYKYAGLERAHQHGKFWRV